MQQQQALGLLHLNVFEAGTGRVLLFIHGFPLDHTMWSQQLAYLSRTHRCLAPDLRGFGQSSGSTEGTSIRQYAADLAELLDALNVTEPVTLCGLSMGGSIAFQFVQHYPDRVERLILCDTRAAADAPDVQATRHALAARVLQDGADFLALSMIERLFAEQTIREQPAVVAATQQVIRSTRPESIAAGSLALAGRPDVTHLLDTLDIPTLVIVGSEDIITPPAEMRTVAQAIMNASYVEVPGAGHMAPLESPEIVNHAIEHFLAAT